MPTEGEPLLGLGLESEADELLELEEGELGGEVLEELGGVGVEACCWLDCAPHPAMASTPRKIRAFLKYVERMCCP